jgi:hypothetical protein
VTRGTRWDARAWLLWAGGCVLLYLAALAGFAAAIAVRGRAPAGLAAFTAWYLTGLAAAVVLTATWQLGRPPRSGR